MRLILCAVAFTLWSVQAWATTVPHVHTERITEEQNSTTTFTAVTGIAQASGNFTVGKKYLIIATGMFGFTASTTSRSDVRVVHGTTAFEGSTVECNTANATPKEPYFFLTVWTAVSSEGIDIEFRRNPTSTGTATVDFVSLFTMQLDDYFVDGTDYKFGERTNDDTLSGSYTTGGSITFTPATASHNWLILGFGNFNYAASTATITSRMNQDAGTTTVPIMIQQPYNNNNVMNFPLVRVLSLPASSVTFTEEAISSGASSVRRYSAIFALDLSKFSAHGYAMTDADANFASTSGYGDLLQSASITPTSTADVFMLAAFGFDKANVGRLSSARLQLDNSDQPAGQTTAAYTHGNVFGTAGDEQVWVFSTLESLTAAAHTLDLDGHVSSLTSTPSYQQRTIAAFALDIPTTTRRPMAPLLLE